MLFIKYVLIFIVFTINNIRLETIKICNQKNENLEFAYVLNLSNDNWSITDHNGLAPLPINTKLNDSLKIQRYGYKTFYLLLKEDNTIVNLKVEPIELKNVEIEILKTPTFSNQISVTKKPGEEDISHKEYLEIMPGVRVKTLGGPGSISTVSINGGPTSQTKVTLNGFDLSSMQTGVTDLSQLPTAFIDEARIITSGHKLMRSGSQNGVLELNTWKPNNSLSFSSNSHNSKSVYGKFSWESKLFHTSFIIGQRHDVGDFLVEWRNEKFKRENNYFNQHYGSLQLNGRINKNIFFKGLALVTKQKRGVPGQVWSPSNARHKDNLYLYASSLNWITKLGEGSLKVYLRSSDDYYDNPQYAMSNKNRLSTSSIYLSNPIARTNNYLLDFSLSLEKQSLESDTDTYIKDIITSRIKMIYKLSRAISFASSVQNNYSANFFNQTVYSLSSTYHFKNKFLNKLEFSSSTHFRHPTFNDLYWKPGGNPELEPESGKNHSVNFSSKNLDLGVVSFSIFESKTENLIQWLPIQSYWQAKNLNNAKRYGFSGSLLKKSKTFLTRVSFSLTHSHWGDDKKLLRYSPKEIANLYVEKKIVDFTLSLNSHYTGEMISMYSYPNNNIIPENVVTSLHISKKYQFQNIEPILTLSILNIFNKQHESSKGYPEPGRTVGLKITLKQKRK